MSGRQIGYCNPASKQTILRIPKVILLFVVWICFFYFLEDVNQVRYLIESYIIECMHKVSQIHKDIVRTYS